MSDTKISEARIAAAQERIDAYHPQPAELAEQQGDALDHAKTLDLMRAGYHVDAVQRVAALYAGIAALAATGKQQVGEVQEPVSTKAVRQFIADRTPNDEHREDILSGDHDHTAWFDHIRELMAALAARQPVNQCDGCRANMPVEGGIHRNATSDFHGIHMACQSDKYSLQPLAWQMRTDERHNGFDDDKWMEIPRDEYEAYKRVIGGNGPKSLAGTTERGDLRIDDGGWMIELRQLFDAPPAQGIDLGPVHAAVESLLEFADHHESCGDSDSFNNAEFQACGCGFDSACEQIWDALDGRRDAAPGVGNG